MNKSLRKLSLCALALPLLVFGTPAQAAMTGAQMKAAVSGKNFRYSGPYTGTVSYRANGTSAITYTYKGQVKSKTGTWWISGNKFCTKQSRAGTKGKKTAKCSGAWTDLGGGKYKTSNSYTLTPRLPPQNWPTGPSTPSPPGLVPGVHSISVAACSKGHGMDARNKSGHDSGCG